MLFTTTPIRRKSRPAPGRGTDIAFASAQQIGQTPEGSWGQSGSNRCYRAECSGTCCPKGSKEMTYRCKQCGIAFFWSVLTHSMRVSSLAMSNRSQNGQGSSLMSTKTNFNCILLSFIVIIQLTMSLYNTQTPPRGGVRLSS